MHVFFNIFLVKFSNDKVSRQLHLIVYTRIKYDLERGGCLCTDFPIVCLSVTCCGHLDILP